MKKQASNISRREVLKTLAMGSVASVAATLTGPVLAQSEDVTQVVKGEGYRETEHIRAYYASL
ncbi:twin-arginine translocation signal domain-containing protein [Shewanella sp. D64]|uniref:twin-arginine translocation signal domain-containing protein n=1 Tax=unclassified Shewanella TaxID=196818 RepID=UPI0022BA550F|nr:MULTISPECIES: twin-arginine translocation signal domain-containing protein [unclassified Shewanella]MEC4726267.1 twin-arginine translocation signal domain-containing protein [Shewanella sp. D64]MEC4738279.1 twin-arginine translocation signal domain-containing protein [Shewanella sp. E94]WBJ95417.1 twin-arginine translocation signal domain-containing protein [Shewanella sp. MTB7]